MDISAIFSGLMLILTGIGATIVLVIQARSAAKLAEIKAVADSTKVVADKTKEVADATKVVTDQVHVLTNTNYSEQRAIIAKQADQLEAMRRDVAANGERHTAEIASLVAQLAEMKALVGKAMQPPPQPKSTLLD